MSLFGSPPNESTAASSSLFEERPALGQAASQSSLFADPDPDTASSPWGLPVSKKQSLGDLIKTLLPASDVPDSYIDTYDTLLDSDGLGGGISLTGVRKILEASGLSPEVQSKILGIVVPAGAEESASVGQGVGRGQVNVLLALIGLAQEDEEITLDGVDERRRKLPIPTLAFSDSAHPVHTSKGSQATDTPHNANFPEEPVVKHSTPIRSRTRQDDSLGFPESDPWSSPALHRGHNHSNQTNVTPKANGMSEGRPVASEQDPSPRNPNDASPGPVAGLAVSSHNPPRPSAASRRESGGWNSYEDSRADPFPSRGDSSLGGEGFGQPGDASGDQDASFGPMRSPGTGRHPENGSEEGIAVTLLPDKEGVFMFQHRNYQISSTRRGSKVVRRFSDFVWLLDCLHKRYPFRQLPLLPPKRVAVNGNHILSDASFIEKRRRGIVRFTSALARHPVLSQEQLVVMFLTVPTELAVWRKQAAISVQEEFAGKTLPPTLEESLPANLSETFDVVRSSVRQSVDIYINLCGLVDRLVRRNEGFAADYLRLSLALQTLAGTSEGTYAVDTSEVSALNAGLQATARHLSISQSLLEDESKTWDGGVLEDLKRQRDTLVSIRDMFDRRDRLSKNNIPALERRIENNENKLVGLRNRPEGTVKPGEVQKVEGAIVQDKQSIVAQHARGVFIKECILNELRFFQSSQYYVSRLHQDWSQERVKFAEFQVDNWRSLCDRVEGMPLGD